MNCNKPITHVDENNNSGWEPVDGSWGDDAVVDFCFIPPAVWYVGVESGRIFRSADNRETWCELEPIKWPKPKEPNPEDIGEGGWYIC